MRPDRPFIHTAFYEHPSMTLSPAPLVTWIFRLGLSDSQVPTKLKVLKRNRAYEEIFSDLDISEWLDEKMERDYKQTNRLL